MMQLSQKGLDLIKHFEGLKLKAYKVTPREKYYTIGYGHNGSDVKENERITRKQAENILKKDVEKFVEGVNKCLKVPVNQNQFDALVSFAYNVGLGALKSSTLLDFVNKRDFKHATQEFDLWIHSGGKVMEGLVNRRNAEQSLFDTPIHGSTKNDPKSTKEYRVIHGDTLSRIAVKHNTTVNGLLHLNPKITDKDRIFVGQIVIVPNEEYPQVSYIPYTIEDGDTLSTLAKKYGTSVSNIMEVNPQIKDKDKIFAGDKIKIPVH